eukprot:CAMPEP_0204876492 /NCGR_PEP_ID=MMETSP1348-20121228/47673_1 /ASSEMBLY_ACC=CAM_ASM_000700 /TAXON_ID=215587 /ORGANISM="Aplanochytrium stocchinoi, Strain GSBS06" /LENGTH=344 /DNA_ID=CAMNT_0052033265 /DNA_START=483 /DNA_END=1517 /DNA_ORIENTATION=-
MIVENTILNRLDDLGLFLGYHHTEQPLVIQLGGNNPDKLAKCASIAQEWGYSEINLNCGCPSNKVAGQNFGASLMLEPETVRNCVKAMQRVVDIPVTVKCRLGVDKQEGYENIHNFVSGIPECDHFIIHARNCILKGLSPAKNRTIPPLKYHYVYNLTKDFPDKKFSLNGHVQDVSQTKEIFTENESLFGVMIGRAAWHNTAMLAKLDDEIFGEPTPQVPVTRRSIIGQYMEYVDEIIATRNEAPSAVVHSGTDLALLKPLAGLLSGCPGASKYRKSLFQSEKRIAERNSNLQEIVQKAMDTLPEGILDKPISNVPNIDSDSNADIKGSDLLQEETKLSNVLAT